jgi:HlyD family secretion protein
VLAPDNGVISARVATVGGVTQPGQELFRLIRDGRLEWRAEVTAADLTRVKPGQRVTLSLPGNGKAEGKVRVLAPTIDPQTRNALVYVDLTTKGDARAGMFARGSFDLGKSSALTVPQQSVVVRDGFSYVFTVGADNRVSQRKVTVGRRSGDRVEITEGLPAGVAVVAAGAGFLNDGDLVAVAQPPTRGQVPDPTPGKK